MAPLAGASSMIGEENASRAVSAPRERANGAENPEDFFFSSSSECESTMGIQAC